MKRVKLVTGVILNDGGPLNGVACVQVAQVQAGIKVRLSEDRGAYKRGDVVIVGNGEFIPTKNTTPGNSWR